MAQTTTLQLLPQTAYNTDNPVVVGTAQKAAGYYQGNKNLQTVTWDFTSVNCTMVIEASLVESPSVNSDWFVVHTVNTGGISTQRTFQNIEGNYTWIRCKINSFQAGVIQYVKVSY